MTWRETTLGEVADIVSGGTPRTKNHEYWDGGDILWVTPTEVTAQEGQVITDTERKITQVGLDNSAAKILPVDTVLVTSRATIGATAITGAPMATNQGFKSLVADEEQVLPRYLLYWVQNNRHEFEARASGSTFKEINKTDTVSIPISVPSLEVQRRIVDLIDHVDRVSALHTKLSGTSSDGLLGDLRRGVLTDLLSGQQVIPASYDRFLDEVAA